MPAIAHASPSMTTSTYQHITRKRCMIDSPMPPRRQTQNWSVWMRLGCTPFWRNLRTSAAIIGGGQHR